MKVKTNELSGAALDWAVAKCEPDSTLEIYFDNETGEPLCHDDWSDNQEFRPSTNWSQGGPIIEREKIGFKYTGAALDFVAWVNGQLSTKHDKYGETPLIAAMRCYVASKLGDEVEIPEELK